MSDESTYPEPSDPSDPTSPSVPTDPPPPPDPDDEEYIPIEVVPPPEPVPPGDGFTFGVVVAPAPPPPAGASVVATAAITATTLDVDVFLIGAEAGVPTVTPLDNAEIRRYFEYLDRKLKFENAHSKEGIGRTAEHAPAGSLLLVVTNKSLNTASAGVVNIRG